MSNNDIYFNMIGGRLFSIRVYGVARGEGQQTVKKILRSIVE